MYVGLKQPRGDGERYVTPARAAAKETTSKFDLFMILMACFCQVTRRRRLVLYVDAQTILQ